jgi:hypothetical protein
MSLAYVFYSFSTAGLLNFLIWCLIVAAVAYIVGWILSLIGVPAVVVKIVYAIAALIVLAAMVDWFAGPVVVR